VVGGEGAVATMVIRMPGLEVATAGPERAVMTRLTLTVPSMVAGVSDPVMESLPQEARKAPASSKKKMERNRMDPPRKPVPHVALKSFASDHRAPQGRREGRRPVLGRRRGSSARSFYASPEGVASPCVDPP